MVEQHKLTKDELCVLDYQKVFSSDEGQRVLRNMMLQFHIFEDCFVPGHCGRTEFKEGARAVVLHILKTMCKELDANGFVNEQKMALNDYGQEK